jgi:hypothetical protein
VSVAPPPDEQAANTKEATKTSKTIILNRDILLSFMDGPFHLETIDRYN